MQVSETVRSAGAALFDVDPNSLDSLGGSGSAVYSCRRGSRECVLKFIPMPADQIPIYQEKIDFVCYLAEHGAPLVTLIPSAQGRLFECLPGEEASYGITLALRVTGRHASPRNPYDWNERFFEAWGQVTGKLHALARRYPRWEKSASPGEATLLMDWQDECRFFVEWCPEPKIAAKLAPLHDLFQALPRDRSGYGLTHNDLHMRNFLYYPEVRAGNPITILDFDACAYHWFFNDIACALYHALIQGGRNSPAARQVFARTFLDCFMQGYTRENELDRAWFQHLPAFLKYRDILLYVAVSHDWPEGKRTRWQISFLAEKRARILRGVPILTEV